MWIVNVLEMLAKFSQITFPSLKRNIKYLSSERKFTRYDYLWHAFDYRFARLELAHS